MNVLYARPRIKTNRKSPRPSTPFGAGILPFVPHVGRTSFTANDQAEAALLFAEQPAKPVLTPAELMAQIRGDIDRCKELGRRQDALAEVMRKPLPPISGGAPARFVPSPQDWDDYHRFSVDLDQRYDDDQLYIGACG
jgi:hypothetical protein